MVDPKFKINYTMDMSSVLTLYFQLKQGVVKNE